MEQKAFKMSIDIVTLKNNKKFISLDDLLLSLYEMSVEGYNVIVVKNFINSLKSLKPTEEQ